MKYRIVQEFAGIQHGLVTRTQLAQTYSRSQVEVMIRNGLLERMRPAVYRVLGGPRGWEQDICAVTLAIPASRASHLSAALLWGLHQRPCPLEVVVRDGRTVRMDGVRVHETSILTASKRVNGIRTTSAPRTLIDIACGLQGRRLADALERALQLQILTFSDLRNEIEHIGEHGRDGVGVIRDLLDRFDPQDERCASGFERRTRRALRSAGLPEPVKQLPVKTGSGNRYVDFAYPQICLAIEVDGRAWHTRLNDFEKGWSRNGELVERGWRVVHVTHRNFDADIARVLRLYRRFSQDQCTA